ncbi:MAG: hypothetical protein KIPDCIKN_04359 [Haliscomenobacter sp.]|nr:hypothetical protein [Haliscomenobacter sp.]
MPSSTFKRFQSDLWGDSLSQASFELELAEGGGLLFEALGFDLGKVLQGDKKSPPRSVNGTASFEEISRSGHLFRLEGADLSHFKRNPIVLAMHEMATPDLMPGVIGHVRSVSIEGRELHFQGMTFDDDPLSEAWYQKVSKGLVRMVSIGARPLEWEIAEKEVKDSKGNKRPMRYLDVLQWELVEISVVPIGANRKAMIRRLERQPDSEPQAGAAARIEELSRRVDELRQIVAQFSQPGADDDSGTVGEAFGDASFPDAAFVVERGAEKKDGKTVQKYRHLPHHRKSVTDPSDNGSVDVPHLRNALARVAQVKPISEGKEAFVSRARAHLMKHARALLRSHKEAIDDLLSIEGIDDPTVGEDPSGKAARAVGLAQSFKNRQGIKNGDGSTD